MLDLSPEKIMALMAIGLVVLGPQRLPSAARTFAHGLARAKRLTETLTQPVHDSLAEPLRSIEGVMADMRDVIHAPTPTLTSTRHPASPSGPLRSTGLPTASRATTPPAMTSIRPATKR